MWNSQTRSLSWCISCAAMKCWLPNATAMTWELLENLTIKPGIQRWLYDFNAQWLTCCCLWTIASLKSHTHTRTHAQLSALAINNIVRYVASAMYLDGYWPVELCCQWIIWIQARVSHFIFLRESRFYGSGVLAKVWDAEMREFYASHNLVELWDVYA